MIDTRGIVRRIIVVEICYKEKHKHYGVYIWTLSNVNNSENNDTNTVQQANPGMCKM